MSHHEEHAALLHSDTERIQGSAPWPPEKARAMAPSEKQVCSLHRSSSCVLGPRRVISGGLPSWGLLRYSSATLAGRASASPEGLRTLVGESQGCVSFSHCHVPEHAASPATGSVCRSGCGWRSAPLLPSRLHSGCSVSRIPFPQS